jgi:hypothetical protein
MPVPYHKHHILLGRGLTVFVEEQERKLMSFLVLNNFSPTSSFSNNQFLPELHD